MLSQLQPSRANANAGLSGDTEQIGSVTYGKGERNMITLLRCSRALLIAVCVFCCASVLCADVPAPKDPEDISAEIIKCDPNSCQVSDRLIGSMAGLPGCLIDLSAVDGERQVRQVDNFRKPMTHLQPSGEIKVMYHSWLDETRAKSAKILGFLTGNLEKNDRLEVKSTMLPGVSLLPEDLDYEKIAAAFQGKSQAEIDKYSIVMSVLVYEVSGAVYNTSSRKVDIDWPCYALAGGKNFLYKSGQESSKCLLMAVYAPIPFCVGLDTLAKTPVTKGGPDRVGSLSVGPDEGTKVDYSRVTESSEVISKLLSMYVKAHKPTVSIADAPRAVIAEEPK